MDFNRNKLYSILFIACIAGYIWIYYVLTNTENKSFEVCLIKHNTNIPCPSCGSTRSIVSLTKGDFMEALLINPLGYIVGSIMFISPLWIILDIATKKKTLYEFYQKVEKHLKMPKYAIPLTLLVIVNWIWNITKGI